MNWQVRGLSVPRDRRDRTGIGARVPLLVLVYCIALGTAEVIEDLVESGEVSFLPAEQASDRLNQVCDPLD